LAQSTKEGKHASLLKMSGGKPQTPTDASQMKGKTTLNSIKARYNLTGKLKFITHGSL
jgi:hypothetical protein